MIDLRDAAAKALKAAYPATDCHIEEAPQKFERPAFVVEVLPVSSQWLSCGHYQREALISVGYYPEDRSNEACYTMADDLMGIFAGQLVVGDRVLALAGAEAEVINKELIFRMSVSYIDSVDESKVPGYDPEAQLMGELTVSAALNDE